MTLTYICTYIFIFLKKLCGCTYSPIVRIKSNTRDVHINPPLHTLYDFYSTPYYLLQVQLVVTY